MKSSRTRDILKGIAVLALGVMPGCRDLGSATSLGYTSSSLTINSVNEGTGQVTYSAPSGYTYTSVSINFGDLKASALCRGTTLFGVKGLALCYAACTDPFFLHASRDVGSSKLGVSSTDTSAYHEVARILLDDDGGFTSELQVAQPTSCSGDVNGTSCVVSPIVSIPKSTHDLFQVCGTTQATVDARIADCKNLNSPAVSGGLPWKGKVNGTGGQGDWDLVTVSQAPDPINMFYYEVWRDSQTLLLWSSRSSAVIGAPGWCQAAGNYDSSDPYAYCAVNLTSYCSESLAPKNGIVVMGLNPILKGNLDMSSTPAIRWRLPTLADYKIARANGIQFVMGDMGALGYMQAKLQSQQSYEWTATIDSVGTGSSDSRKNAYYFSSDGKIGSANRNANFLYARCVGG
jgi:hypothetical protein